MFIDSLKYLYLGINYFRVKDNIRCYSIRKYIFC